MLSGKECLTESVSKGIWGQSFIFCIVQGLDSLSKTTSVCSSGEFSFSPARLWVTKLSVKLDWRLGAKNVFPRTGVFSSIWLTAWPVVGWSYSLSCGVLLRTARECQYSDGLFPTTSPNSSSTSGCNIPFISVSFCLNNAPSQVCPLPFHSVVHSHINLSCGYWVQSWIARWNLVKLQVLQSCHGNFFSAAFLFCILPPAVWVWPLPTAVRSHSLRRILYHASIAFASSWLHAPMFWPGQLNCIWPLPGTAPTMLGDEMVLNCSPQILPLYVVKESPLKSISIELFSVPLLPASPNLKQQKA